ncbi:tumor necrosis factor receptor superfamily member 18 isoform X2 [Toxotes jaculatrix]|uniref:tumor necrosis factor receptor superfamily member 18 isoform X2 n=1 Tax=Toxotes jaculatrix TaxID=941984 RepID=UPI001B3ADB91|nr:tumor necrosis factor receptor superfamily member 18 isoform X2 [Toxotes jaculatrix]
MNNAVTCVPQEEQTVCTPCEEGYFSNQSIIFDRCEKCQECQHDYAEKCTLTTNAKCSCRPGFLCSDSLCSVCGEHKCGAGEKLNRTDIPKGSGLIQYSYRCELACPDKAYFDAKENLCKPWTQCSALGLAELIPGNKTHNSVCNEPGSIHVILSIGFLLLSLSLFVFLAFACIKNLRKHKACNDPTNTRDFHLSKEESGFQITVQGDCKDSFGELHLGHHL